MTNDAKVSRRGVYYDLTESPYEYNSPYGDSFKFSSAKKLEIYTRDVEKELTRADTFFARNGLGKLLPEEIRTMVRRAVYLAFYRQVER